MARKKGDYLKTLSHAAMALLLATPAAAQERAGGRVSADASAAETDLSEELIVTARRQSETITDVPATVNVVSDEALSTRLVGSGLDLRSEEHTSELQSLMRNSYAYFCLKKKTTTDIK